MILIPFIILSLLPMALSTMRPYSSTRCRTCDYPRLPTNGPCPECGRQLGQYLYRSSLRNIMLGIAWLTPAIMAFAAIHIADNSFSVGHFIASLTKGYFLIMMPVLFALFSAAYNSLLVVWITTISRFDPSPFSIRYARSLILICMAIVYLICRDIYFAVMLH